MVEAYLDCFATKDVSKVSFADDIAFEGPGAVTIRHRRFGVEGQLMAAERHHDRTRLISFAENSFLDLGF